MQCGYLFNLVVEVQGNKSVNEVCLKIIYGGYHL